MRRVAARDGSPLAGIAGQLHPHALRAAFVTAALDAGVPIEEVATAAGHTHIATTLRYDRRRKQRRTGAFRAVSGLVAEEHAEHGDPAGMSHDPQEQLAERLAEVDAQQVPGQTTVPMPGDGQQPDTVAPSSR